ncbi:MAG TPA: hypothetical protein VIV60_32695 [Polyangiaceae bacterium]
MTDLTRDAKALILASRLHYHIGVCDKARIRRKLTHRLSATGAAGTLITTAVMSAEAARATVPVAFWGWAPSSVKALAMFVFVGATTASGVSLWRASGSSTPVVRVVDATKRGRAGSSEPRQNGTARNLPPNNAAELHPITAQGEAVMNASTDNAPISNVPVSEAPRAGSSATATNAPRDAASAPAAATHPRNESVAPLNARSRPVAASASSRTAQRPSPSIGVLDGDADVRLMGQANAIRDCRAALQRGDAHGALVTLDRWLPSGKGGELEQESLYLRVSAYCQLHERARARQFADAFLSRFSGSLLDVRVRRSCAFEAPRLNR